MEIVLNEEVLNLGITEVDIKCMLKACNKEVLTKVYEPSLEEVNALINKACEEEMKKQRTVLKWISVINELNTMIKE